MVECNYPCVEEYTRRVKEAGAANRITESRCDCGGNWEAEKADGIAIVLKCVKCENRLGIIPSQLFDYCTKTMEEPCDYRKWIEKGKPE